MKQVSEKLADKVCTAGKKLESRWHRYTEYALFQHKGSFYVVVSNLCLNTAEVVNATTQQEFSETFGHLPTEVQQ